MKWSNLRKLPTNPAIIIYIMYGAERFAHDGGGAFVDE